MRSRYGIVIQGLYFTEFLEALNKTGGYFAMIESYFNATASVRPPVDPNNATSDLCGEPLPYAMKLLRSPALGVSDLPWTGAVFGLFVSHVWYWCTDQKIVQVSLASKDLVHAKGGTILLSYLKLLPLWMMIFPGMAARVLYTDDVACADPKLCQETCNSAYCRKFRTMALHIFSDSNIFPVTAAPTSPTSS